MYPCTNVASSTNPDSHRIHSFTPRAGECCSRAAVGAPELGAAAAAAHDDLVFLLLLVGLLVGLVLEAAHAAAAVPVVAPGTVYIRLLLAVLFVGRFLVGLVAVAGLGAPAMVVVRRHGVVVSLLHGIVVEAAAVGRGLITPVDLLERLLVDNVVVLHGAAGMAWSLGDLATLVTCSPEWVRW